MGENLPVDLSDVVEENKDKDSQVYELFGTPTSVYSLCEHIPTLKRSMDRLREEMPDVFDHDEAWFKEKIREFNTVALKRVRLAFWLEYESALTSGRQMRVRNIISGSVTEKVFHKYIEDNMRLAYIMCPPANYVVQLKETHQAGLDALREIMSAKVTDEDGYLIPRAADVVIKAFAIIDLRLKGAIVQRIDQRTLNVNANTNLSEDAAKQLTSDMSDLDRQLEETRKKLLALTEAPRTQELHPMEVLELREAVTIEVEESRNVQLDGNVATKVLKR